MKRIYHHWEEWECCKFGMYDTSPPSGISRDEAVNMYSDFLADIPRFKRAMSRVLEEWPISCEQFLSNENINRIAWLGQSSMCMETKVPFVFRAGFSRLDKNKQNAANMAAEEYLSKWLGSRVKSDTFALENENSSTHDTGMSTRKKGIRSKIDVYVRHWKTRGYPSGIPDEVPHQLMQLNLAPSYRAISLALLRNDMQLTSLGFAAAESCWYGALKRIEINSRPGAIRSQLEFHI